MEINKNYSSINSLYNGNQTFTSDNNKTASNQNNVFNKAQNGDTFEFSNATNPNNKQAAANNEKIDQLKKIDKNVIEHEEQHQRTAGSLGSSPSYKYAIGPDGKNYAVGGHVNVQIKKDSDPNKTIQNAEIVKRSALAPHDPSEQDLKVAYDADENISKAKLALAQKKEKQSKNANATGSRLNLVG